MGVQQVLGSLDWGTLVVATLTAIVAAWVTAWVNNRYERGRLIRMWKLQQSKDRLGSLREYTHQFAQGVGVLPLLPKEERDQEATKALRAIYSARAISGALGDEQLSDATASLLKPAIQLYEAGEGMEESAEALAQAAARILGRCDELLEETSNGKSSWEKIRRAK